MLLVLHFVSQISKLHVSKDHHVVFGSRIEQLCHLLMENVNKIYFSLSELVASKKNFLTGTDFP